MYRLSWQALVLASLAASSAAASAGAARARVGRARAKIKRRSWSRPLIVLLPGVRAANRRSLIPTPPFSIPESQSGELPSAKRLPGLSVGSSSGIAAGAVLFSGPSAQESRTVRADPLRIGGIGKGAGAPSPGAVVLLGAVRGWGGGVG